MSGLTAQLRGRRGALKLDLALEAPPGEITVLTGRSGAGKSTLLRALAGLDRLEGRVEAAGEVWQDESRFTPPHRRAVGYVFQNAALLPHLSVEANIRFGWRRARCAQVEFDRAVALTRTGPLLGRAPSTLSGGECRRVAVARALACGPKLLLLDEPMAGLDDDARAELIPELRALLVGMAAPVVYVSHDLAEVTRLADRVLHLDDRGVTPSPMGEEEPLLAGRDPSEVRRLATAALRAGLA